MPSAWLTLNEAEKLLIKVAGACGTVSIAILGWMALSLYSTNAIVSSLRQRMTDQIQTTSQRLDRMQISIDKNTDHIQRIEVRDGERDTAHGR